MDQLKYGNEGKGRGQRKSALTQMYEETIVRFVRKIDRILIPSGHLFLWIDKFHYSNGCFRKWIYLTELEVVDLLVWDKVKMGLGYRTRGTIEFCIVLQKKPRRAKGVWKIHDLKDLCSEKSNNSKGHPHKKPIEMQCELIKAVSDKGDIIIDPAAGSFSVLESANKCNRNFLGCDLNG